jgi:hypothetical protein
MRIRVRSAALAVTLGICLLAVSCKREISMSDLTQKGVDCATPREVVARARAAVAAEAADTAWELTPLLPAKWPPSGDLVVTQFAYVRLALPTGIARWEVRSPFLRVDLPLAPRNAVPQLARLDARPLAPPEAALPHRASDAVMEQAAEPLLEALCARALPLSEAAARIREAYRAWSFEHATLAEELRPFCPSFFAWLDERL